MDLGPTQYMTLDISILNTSSPFQSFYQFMVANGKTSHISNMDNAVSCSVKMLTPYKCFAYTRNFEKNLAVLQKLVLIIMPS